MAMVVERPFDRRESKIGPGDLFPGEELHLEAFRAGREEGLGEMGAVDDLYLADPGYVINREEPVDDDPGIGFLQRLAHGTRAGRFIELEIARGQGPEAAARIDRAPAQQQPVTIGADRAHHDL